MIKTLALLIAATFVLADPAMAADSKIYKTTDANGNTVYTDVAPENSEPVKVEEPQTYPAGRYAQDYEQFKPAKPANKDAASAASYATLAITSPSQDEAVRNNPGNLTIDFQIQPNLKEGQGLQLLMDGKVVSKVTSPEPISLSNVDRGTHQVQLQVYALDSGTVLQSSKPVTFTLLRYHLPPKSTNAPK